MYRSIPALLLLAACGTETAPKTPAGAFETDKGLYELHLTPSDDPWPAGTDVHLTVAIRSEDAPVDGATLTVRPWMPSMGHGISEDPIATELGDGEYAVSWVFPMSGSWELDLLVDGAAGTDAHTVQADVQ